MLFDVWSLFSCLLSVVCGWLEVVCWLDVLRVVCSLCNAVLLCVMC